jgi:hypothetical protein
VVIIDLAAVPLLDTQQDINGVLFVSVRGLLNDPQVSTSPLAKNISWEREKSTQGASQAHSQV